MNDVNYISPSSIMPQLGQVQIPGLQGYMLGNQERDYRDIMDLQKLLGGMGAQKEALSLDEKVKDVPMKDAERAYKTLGFQIDTDQMPSRKGFALNKEFRTDQLDQAAFPTSIEAAGITGQTNVDNARAGQLEARLQHIANLAGMVDGPMGMAQVMEQAEAYGIKPGSKLHQQLSSRKDPKDMKKYLSGLEKHLNTTKAQGIRAAEAKAAAEAAEWTRREEIARLNNQTRVEIGQGNNAATVRAAELRAQAAERNKQTAIRTLQQDYIDKRNRLGPQHPDTLEAKNTMERAPTLRGAGDWAGIFAQRAATEYAEKNKKPMPPQLIMETYEKLRSAFGGSSESTETSQVQNPQVAPTGDYSKEGGLRGIMGNLPQSFTPEELNNMFNEFQRMPDGPAKLQMGVAIKEAMSKVSGPQQLSGPLPGLQQQTPSPAPQVPTGVRNLPSFQQWKAQQGKK